jgi:hypothetical protein
MITIKFRQGWYVVTLPKCLLVLSRAEFSQAFWAWQMVASAGSAAGAPV